MWYWKAAIALYNISKNHLLYSGCIVEIDHLLIISCILFNFSQKMSNCIIDILNHFWYI